MPNYDKPLNKVKSDLIKYNEITSITNITVTVFYTLYAVDIAKSNFSSFTNFRINEKHKIIKLYCQLTDNRFVSKLVC